MDWIMVFLSFLSGTAVQHSHQTLKVSQVDYSVAKPIGTVSIIVPAFNEEHYIERLLQSIQAQNIIRAYPEMFEIIVVDNQSNDRTVEIASRYARVVASPRGKLSAKNTGMQMSSGEIIVFIDADCVLSPNHLNLLLRHFSDSEIVAVCGLTRGDVDIFSSIITTQYNATYTTLHSVLPDFAKSLLGLTGANLAVRKTAYYEAGGYDETVDQFNRAEVTQEEEKNFIIRLDAIGKIILDSEATLWHEMRIERCSNMSCEFANTPQCAYCKEVESRERF